MSLKIKKWQTSSQFELREALFFIFILMTSCENQEKGYTTVSEMLETMHENDLFDIFPEFSKVVHMLAVIPATSFAAERSISALCRLKTYLRSTMG